MATGPDKKAHRLQDPYVDGIHPPFYYGTEDPGPVGAHLWWVLPVPDDVTPQSHTFYRRNAANSSWLEIIDTSKVVQNVSWKNWVRVATTANGTLASAFENGDTVDGVVLATGDRILLKNQTTQSENGLYQVNASGAPSRLVEADAGDEIKGAVVLVLEGTANAGTIWYLTNTGTITLGSTNLVFEAFGGGGGGEYEAIYRSFAESANVVNPDVSTDTLINAMSVSFTLADTRDVEIFYSVLAEKVGGNCRTVLYDGTTPLLNGNNGPTKSIPTVANSDNDVKYLSMRVMKTLAAGSYTINLKHQASANLNAITFYERSIVVKVLAP